jgi:hypothetical protein
VKLFFIAVFFSSCFSVVGQPFAEQTETRNLSFEPSSKTFYYNLGGRRLPVRVQQYGEVRDIVFINLHDDETTAVQATKAWLEKKGGLFIKIDNYHKRNIRFGLGSSSYLFDPNRIFNREGILQTLKFHHNSINEKAVDEIEKFSDWLLRLIPENPECIIALHNNTDGAFSVMSYLPGNQRNRDAKLVNVAETQDPDDFFLTTNEELFEKIKEAGYNIMLQDNEKASDDGSLSVYCGKKNIRYVNCETQHGKVKQYSQMMGTLLNLLANKSPEENVFAFNMVTGDSLSPVIPSNTKIYFNHKVVGELVSVKTDKTSGEIYGEFKIDKSFPVFSNTDFFLIEQPGNETVIDIRIDPTREKKPVDPETDFITIIVKRKAESSAH